MRRRTRRRTRLESPRERGAGKSSRAANCPPSYPPYTLSHTLARNHPYPPLPPPRSPPTRPSHPYTPSTPFALPAHPLFIVLSSPLRPPFLSAVPLPPPLCRRLESFRLPTPYKRSCCPFITTTPATTTTERPTPISIPRASFHPSFSTVHPSLLPSFGPSSLPATFDAQRPATFPSFLLFCSTSTAAILINALTLPLHNYARRRERGSNNTISRVYRELRALETMSPRVRRAIALRPFRFKDDRAAPEWRQELANKYRYRLCVCYRIRNCRRHIETHRESASKLSLV